MKRLVRKLVIAAVGCLMVVALSGCDLLGTMPKSGLSPQFTKHRFSPPGEPSTTWNYNQSGSFAPVQGLSLSMP